MQLRSEEALRAVQERHLAAEADMLAYNLQTAREEKAKDDAALQTHRDMYTALTETAPPLPGMEGNPQADAEAKQRIADQWLVNNRPTAAQRVAVARYWMQRPEAAEAALQERLQAAQIRAGAQTQVAETRAEATKYSADQRTAATIERLKRSGMGHDAATTFAGNVNEWREQQAQAEAEGDLERAASFGQRIQDAYEHLNRTHPDASQTLHIKNLQATAQAAYKAYLDTGMKNKKLKEEWERAQKALEGVKPLPSQTQSLPPTAGASSPSPLPEFQVGHTYEDAQGRKRIYRGMKDGKRVWESVK